MKIMPLAKHTKTLRSLLMLNTALTVIALFTGIYDYYSYRNLSLDIDPDETMPSSDVTSGIVGILQIIMFLIVGVAFLQWIYYTNKNLHILSSQRMEFKPGWSIGWYFIPIANLFKPYQSMKELWRVSHKNEAASYAIVKWWWFLWIVSNVLDRLVFSLNTRAESVQDYRRSAAAFVASDGVGIILNIVALVLVTRIGMAYSKNFIEQGAPLEGNPVSNYPRQ